MDAKPFLVEVGRLLQQLHLEAVLIGNAAAALQGAPVTTIDLDFLFRQTPRTLTKLKGLARGLKAVVLRPYYPASEMYRIVREGDGLQLDFMATIHEAVPARAVTIEIEGVPLLVASLADIIRSKRAARRPGIWPCWRFWRKPLKKRPGRKTKLAALARESERDLRELIHRWQALPPERRTNFLRKRTSFRGTAL
ncbi:MAG: hypothetical protein HYS05_02790 [Acidobacteria bacterium]|nr:hypothetical protein [Acidobacteriota bacterium]